MVANICGPSRRVVMRDYASDVQVTRYDYAQDKKRATKQDVDGFVRVIRFKKQFLISASRTWYHSLSIIGRKKAKVQT